MNQAILMDDFDTPLGIISKDLYTNGPANDSYGY